MMDPPSIRCLFSSFRSVRTSIGCLTLTDLLGWSLPLDTRNALDLCASLRYTYCNLKNQVSRLPGLKKHEKRPLTDFIPRWRQIPFTVPFPFAPFLALYS